jgi:serine/threonine-protein kinase
MPTFTPCDTQNGWGEGARMSSSNDVAKAAASPDRGEGPRGTPVRKTDRPSMRPGGASSLIGTILSGRYRIERVIGEGGMGAVYQAEHTHMRKRLAIKVLHPEMSRLTEVVQRFEREAMAAAHIDHPNVATATDFGKLEDGSFFLVLEYVEGKSLRDAIGKSRLTVERALHITRQIASALQRAHALGIVHRDLKPENVMLVERDGDTDFVKVLDFGIAKVPVGELGTGNAAPGQPVLTQLGMVYGTPEYMAPEQALGQAVDARADLYALGVMAYEMLTGQRPFEHESKVALLGMHVTAPVPPMATKAPDAVVPPEVEAIVVRLLAKESTQRFTDAKELVDTISATWAQLAAQGRMSLPVAPGPMSGVSSSQPDASGPFSLPRPSVPQFPPGPISQPSFPQPSSPHLTPLVPSGGANAIPPPPPNAVPPAPLSAPTPVLHATGLNIHGKKVDGRIIVGAGVLALFVAATATYCGLSAAVKSMSSSSPGDSSSTGGSTAGGGTSTEAPTQTHPVGPQGVEAQIKEANAQIARGNYASAIDMLVPVEDKNPDRADVHALLERAYMATKRTADAMREAGLWIKLDDDKAIQDDKLEVDVRNAALGIGEGGVDQAFVLLEQQMKTIGPDILYGIAYDTSTQGYPAAVARARASLNKPDVKAKYSPALSIATDLRTPPQKSCDQLHGLLPRAQKDGDYRALPLLKGLGKMCGGGFLGNSGPCFPCMFKDNALKDATAAVEARSKSPK